LKKKFSMHVIPISQHSGSVLGNTVIGQQKAGRGAAITCVSQLSAVADHNRLSTEQSA
jgi:hypothetical protein